MKKIGILTIVSQNFGNRLQNYALQTVIRQMGCEAETILRKKYSLKDKFKEFIRLLIKTDKRYFKKFNRTIKWSKCIVSREYTTNSLEQMYDMFVIGSDQVWNPHFSFNSDLEYLPMVSPSKKISYAASFGIADIPEALRTQKAKLLSDISRISVREESGAHIVRKLCGRNADVLLDPTLLLSKNEWEEIEEKPKFDVKQKYIMKYILGNDVYAQKISELAKIKDLKIIDVRRKGLPIGPAEFVYLIHHADLICTDSFHASVFSLIFSKPFIIYERISSHEDMSSRIDYFCEKYNLKRHRYSNPDFSIDGSLNSDYTQSLEVLDEERKKALQFLIDAIGLNYYQCK